MQKSLAKSNLEKNDDPADKIRQHIEESNPVIAGKDFIPVTASPISGVFCPSV
ncbi:MAG: hypothetical protein P8X88_09700 [Gammaproteobacteria bacterium]